MALERGPLLLLGSRLRRRRHAVLLQDRPVSGLLVLLAEEERMERHLVGGDADDPELVEERLAFLSVLLDEEVVRRLPSRGFARIAVEVRERQVDLLLRERVEGRSLLEDAPELVVEALDVRLLRRAVRIREPDVDAARQELRRVVLRVGTVVLDHHGIGELGAVVGQGIQEQLAEESWPGDRPEHVEYPRAGLRGLLVPQERQREPRLGEGHREEQLPADRADDGVELAGDDLPDVFPEPAPHVLDRPPDAALGVGLRLGLLVRLLACSREGEVVRLRAEQPVCDPAVDRAFRVAAEDLGIGRDDGHRRLSLPDARGKDLVHLLDGRLVRMHARARKAALGFVLFLRDRGDVELLRERAGALLLASVADEGRVGKSRTRRLAEVRTGLEALRLALALPVAEAVEACPRAFVEMGAEPVRASVALVTRDAVLEELVADRGRVSPDVLGDFWHGEAAPDEELYSVPYVDDHVFHGRILLVSFHVRSRGTRHRRQRTRADRIPETMVVRN